MWIVVVGMGNPLSLWEGDGHNDDWRSLSWERIELGQLREREKESSGES